MNWLKVVTTERTNSIGAICKIYEIRYSYSTGKFYWHEIYEQTETWREQAERAARNLAIKNDCRYVGTVRFSPYESVDMNTVNLEMLAQLTLLKEQTERKYDHSNSSSREQDLP